MKSRLERQERKAADRKAQRATAVRPIASNRRARHEYFIEEKAEAGVVLTGTEARSLREGQANMTDGYVAIENGEAWLLNVHVSPYSPASYNNPDPVRKRKLLLHRREIARLGAKIQKSGVTCVPLSLYFKGRHVKAEIALVTGKKLRDKRETIRTREADRETRAAIKANRR